MADSNALAVIAVILHPACLVRLLWCTHSTAVMKSRASETGKTPGHQYSEVSETRNETAIARVRTHVRMCIDDAAGAESADRGAAERRADSEPGEYSAREVQAGWEVQAGREVLNSRECSGRH